MQYNILGRTGLRVSQLGFGCGSIGGILVRGEYPLMRQAVSRAIEMGINYFDTAPLYGNGQSEVNLGAVLRELKADVLVGSKMRLTGEDIGRVAAGLLGKKPIPVRLPIWSAYLASVASEGVGRFLGGGNSLFNVSKVKQMRAYGWVADVRKARREMGFETVFSLEQGLGETIAWYLWKGLL